MVAGPSTGGFCFPRAPRPPPCVKPGTGAHAGMASWALPVGVKGFSPSPSEAPECLPGFPPPSGMRDGDSKICPVVDGVCHREGTGVKQIIK